MPNFYGFTLILIVASCHGGLVQRHYRDVAQQPDQIPVQVIQYAEGDELNQPAALALQHTNVAPALVATEVKAPVSNEILSPQTDALKPVVLDETPQVAKYVAKTLEEQPKLEDELKKDEEFVGQEVVEAVKKDLAVSALEQAEKPKDKIPETLEPLTTVVEEKPQPVEAEASVQQQLKGVSLNAESEPSVGTVAVDEHVKQPVAAVEVAAANPEEAVRQAVTQPTPPQSSTQQNFLQQLIQPVGQFISQFTGGQQQQQQQAQAVAAVGAAAAPAAPPAPLPTLPGFLNPANAITSAQQAVQNVVNTTSQAFQGFQQFASNIGNSVQSTLGLGGQQQLTTADVTTTRPPGPFQTIFNNLIGGGNQQQQSEPTPGGGGPLQGIFSFFQGGNRPATTTLAAIPTTAEPIKISLPTSGPGVDDKIGEDAVQEVVAPAEEVNEVRGSAEDDYEPTKDSFEETQPEELIVVNGERGAVTEIVQELQP